MCFCNCHHVFVLSSQNKLPSHQFLMNSSWPGWLTMWLFSKTDNSRHSFMTTCVLLDPSTLCLSCWMLQCMHYYGKCWYKIRCISFHHPLARLFVLFYSHYICQKQGQYYVLHFKLFIAEDTALPSLWWSSVITAGMGENVSHCCA